MKSFYKQPVTEVTKVKMENMMQAASPVGNPGVNGVRAGYGTGSSEIWD